MHMHKTSKIEEKIDMQETQPSRIYQHFVLVFILVVTWGTNKLKNLCILCLSSELFLWQEFYCSRLKWIVCHNLYLPVLMCMILSSHLNSVKLLGVVWQCHQSNACLFSSVLGPVTSIRERSQKKRLRKFGHMSKLDLPYLPSSLVWTKKSLDIYSYCLPYLPIQKVWTFLNWSLSLSVYFLTFVMILLVNNHARYHQGHL